MLDKFPPPPFGIQYGISHLSILTQTTLKCDAEAGDAGSNLVHSSMTFIYSDKFMPLKKVSRRTCISESRCCRENCHCSFSCV